MFAQNNKNQNLAINFNRVDYIEKFNTFVYNDSQIRENVFEIIFYFENYKQFWNFKSERERDNVFNKLISMTFNSEE